jgi:quinol monooxygenase YgiN
MHRVIYNFSIKPDCTAELESLVAGWFHLMKPRDGFIAISLFRNTDVEGRYCAVSDWSSEKAYAAFHASPEHQRVAAATAELFTTQERNAYDLVYEVTLRECDS